MVAKNEVDEEDVMGKRRRGNYMNRAEEGSNFAMGTSPPVLTPESPLPIIASSTWYV